MINPYDPHFSSKLYRQEVLKEARNRHLSEQASMQRSGRSPVGLVLAAISQTIGAPRARIEATLKTVARARGLSERISHDRLR
jgi:hypothetical protein